jgi:nicotinate-nucleotide pyrophosphorylase (carboxylating)
MNRQYPSPEAQVDDIVALALAEDLGQGDATSQALIPATLLGRATILAKAAGVLAGIDVARRVFFQVDPSLEVMPLTANGGRLEPGDAIADVSGKVTSILAAERVMLNFLQRLSGIATDTAGYVAAIDGLKAVILDTRKTTPGLRLLEKQAVLHGGGRNHRMNLGDGILIKDNHIAAMRSLGTDIAGIVTDARRKAPAGLEVEIEVTTIAEALEAASAGAEMILLDNMSPDEMRAAVEQLPDTVSTEASGGITLGNVRAVAEAGVDYISVGALTHSPMALDISLEMDPESLELP